MIVVGLALFIPILLHRMKLNVIPVVVAEIIGGIIIGRSGFDIVHGGPWLDILSTLGFIFLMFLSGMEIDFSTLKSKKETNHKDSKDKEPNPLFLSSIIFLAILLLSYLMSLGFVYLGFVSNTFFMTLIISTISLGVVVPTLKEKNILKKPIGQTILLVAVIGDLATMILLAVFVSLYSDGNQNMWLLLLLFLAGMAFYALAKLFKNSSIIHNLKMGSIQIDTRAIFALIIALVGLSESVGAENILGAFLAGVLVSLLSPNKETIHNLDSFGYGFLIPIFFVMVGVELDVWTLIESPKYLVLIPILLLGLLLSKFLPMLLLKKWYDWKVVIGSSFLLTSTLSLVIAAAKIGERVGVITSEMSAVFVLVAVITCIISPIVFNKVFPQFDEDKETVSIIGANRMTLPVSLSLKKANQDVTIFSASLNKIDSKKGEDFHDFPIVELNDVTPDSLDSKGAFNTSKIIIATSNELNNEMIARKAKEKGIENIIVKAEDPKLYDKLNEEGFVPFSTLFSSQMLLKALVLSPSLINLITQEEGNFAEVDMCNKEYDGLTLRRIPFLGDTLILQIYRNGHAIVPHGDSIIRKGDILLVSGEEEHIHTLKTELSHH